MPKAISDGLLDARGTTPAQVTDCPLPQESEQGRDYDLADRRWQNQRRVVWH